MFVSDLASRQDARKIDEYARERLAHRHRVMCREGVGIRDVSVYVFVVVAVVVNDPVIVGELAFRSGYVIAGGRALARRGAARREAKRLFPAVSDTDDIRFQHAIQISGSAVHHDDRTAECVCHWPD